LASSIKHLETLAVPEMDKAKVILSNFLELSSMTVVLHKITNLPIYSLGALAIPQVLDRLGQSVMGSGPGRAYFAHILTPHYSYVFGADCKVKTDIDSWENRFLSFDQEGVPINTVGSRVERYEAYFDQIRCTLGQLQALFDKLRAAGLYDESTIIIHGDHGSRISIWNPEAVFTDQISDRDIIDSYSTLYTVKQPGLPPAYDSTKRSIQAFFAETFLKTPLPLETGDIILRGQGRFDRNLNVDNRLRPFPDYHSQPQDGV